MGSLGLLYPSHRLADIGCLRVCFPVQFDSGE